MPVILLLLIVLLIVAIMLYGITMGFYQLCVLGALALFGVLGWFAHSVDMPWKTAEIVVSVRNVDDIQLIVYKDIHDKIRVVNLSEKYSRIFPDNTNIEVTMYYSYPYKGLNWNKADTYKVL